MASKLYLSTGNGFPILIFLTLLFVGAIFSQDFLMWIIIVLIVLTLVFIIYRWFRWNATGWRKIHFPGMFYYAGFAGQEYAKAKEQNREFDIRIPCYLLSHKFMGMEYRPSEISYALTRLQENEDYFSDIVEENIKDLYPSAEERFYLTAISETRKIPFGPQQVIASVIEDKYGRREVTKYMIALITGEAK